MIPTVDRSNENQLTWSSAILSSMGRNAAACARGNPVQRRRVRSLDPMPGPHERSTTTSEPNLAQQPAQVDILGGQAVREVVLMGQAADISVV